MTHKTTIQKHKRDNAWHCLMKYHPELISSLKHDIIKTNSMKNKSEKEDNYNDCLNFVLSSLSPYPSRPISDNKELSIMKQVASSMVEAMEENVLTENEASAVLEFLASKFIERRFGIMMQCIFDIDSSEVCNFKGLRGVIK